jgi:hypothetical protein
MSVEGDCLGWTSAGGEEDQSTQHIYTYLLKIHTYKPGAGGSRL